MVNGNGKLRAARSNRAVSEQVGQTIEMEQRMVSSTSTWPPHRRKDELVHKKILPRAAYEHIKYKIVAKQK